MRSERLRGASPIAFLATTDGERARAFYEGALALTLVADEPYALVFDLGGTMLRVQKVDRLEAQSFTALGWRVEDVRATVRSLTAAGVAFEQYPDLEQDAAGIWTSPSGARIAWFRDPDANLLSLTEL